ncbi:MAG TPA: metalloregulator ArsR/SmtB family transcription factor [Phycisphaerales bacterium]|nr:metalloregulator ArsR/SmtB family transcription factor [Phycisphaerales bacterium]HMP36774.1 metalloregulator ArsR/SmtB family transcription factor [Phycisphaerales bacterium]
MLGDPVRVRLLRLVSAEELGVGELARVLQLPQSTVSRHLKALGDLGWASRRAEGTNSLYRLDPSKLPDDAASLWTLTRRHFDGTPTAADDDHRLATVLSERRGDPRGFFGRIGGEWTALRGELFGERFSEEALLGLLEPELVVADLGCGTGDVAERLAPLVRRVIAIDREQAMLDAARTRLAGVANVEFRAGEMHALPLRAGEIDVAVAMLVFHHIERPQEALREIGRALRGGGRLLIVDMVAHDRAAWRHSMGHVHLGFAEDDLGRWTARSDLRLLRCRRLRPDAEAKGPGLLAALLRKEQGAVRRR